MTILVAESRGIRRTVNRGCFMAMMAAIKKVLSPISEARIMPHDFKKPSKKWPSAIKCMSAYATTPACIRLRGGKVGRGQSGDLKGIHVAAGWKGGMAASSTFKQTSADRFCSTSESKHTSRSRNAGLDLMPVNELNGPTPRYSSAEINFELFENGPLNNVSATLVTTINCYRVRTLNPLVTGT